MQLPLNCTTRLYTNCTTLQLQLHYLTLDYTTLYQTTVHNTNCTLQYATLIAPHHNYNCNCTCATLITQHYNYNSALHYTTTTTTTTTALHHTTSSSCGEMTAANVATTRKDTTPTTFRSISGFALPSVIHNNQPLLRFPILKLPPPPCAVLLESSA